MGSLGGVCVHVRDGGMRMLTREEALKQSEEEFECTLNQLKSDRLTMSMKIEELQKTVNYLTHTIDTQNLHKLEMINGMTDLLLEELSMTETEPTPEELHAIGKERGYVP